MFGMEDILADQPSNPANNANAMMTTSNVFRNDSNITISFFPSPHLDEQLYRWRPIWTSIGSGVEGVLKTFKNL
jgi:hypothetical protein